MQQLRELTLSHGPVLLEVVAILVVGWTISMVLRGMLRKVMNRAGIDAMLTGFAVNLAYLVLLTLVLVTAIGKLGVGTASFVAVIGTAGLAVGLALQGSLANVAAGVMIIIFRPFKVGDCIEGGGVSGNRGRASYLRHDAQNARQQECRGAQLRHCQRNYHQLLGQRNPSRRYGVRGRLR